MFVGIVLVGIAFCCDRVLLGSCFVGIVFVASWDYVLLGSCELDVFVGLV